MFLRALPYIKTTVLILFIVFACLPLVQMMMISFIATLPQPGTDVGSLTFGNYTNIVSDPNLRSAFGNSIAYVLINICITVPIAIPAAYAFSRMSFLGDKHLFFAFIAFRITPPVVLTLPIFQLFQRSGSSIPCLGSLWPTVSSIFQSRSGFCRVSYQPSPKNRTKPHFWMGIHDHALSGHFFCHKSHPGSQLQPSSALCSRGSRLSLRGS